MIDKEAVVLHDKLIADFKSKRNINKRNIIKETNNIQNCINEVIRKNVIEI